MSKKADDQCESGVSSNQREAWVECDSVTFQRCLQALQQVDILVKVDADRLRTISIWKGVSKKPASTSRVRDSFALFGCAFVAFAAIVVFAIGIGTIAGWLGASQ